LAKCHTNSKIWQKFPPFFFHKRVVKFNPKNLFFWGENFAIYWLLF
jgi:hypothetical protein